MVVSDAVTANAHHGLAAHEVVLLLQTDPHRGLTTEVADERLKEFGPNTLPAPRGAGPGSGVGGRRGREERVDSGLDRGGRGPLSLRSR